VLKRIKFLTLTLVFFLGVFYCFSYINNFCLFIKEDLKYAPPKTSDYWNLNGSLIIDNNWSDTASAYNWCYSKDGYYIIENVTLDAMYSGNGITIKNSNDPFIIRNCSVYNSSLTLPPDFRAAIFLDTVSNGSILSNDLSNNGMNGVFLQNCYNITIANNTINNIFMFGVYSYSSDLIRISHNNLSDNQAGFMLWEGDYQEVIENNIMNYSYAGIMMSYANFTKVHKNVFYNGTVNSLGIYIRSDNCTISENEVNMNGMKGIFVRGKYNNITSNTVKNSSIGIHIEDSGATPSIKNRFIGNIITNNGRGILTENGNNTFILNYLLYNTQYNVRDESFYFDGTKNDWNNETPFGGMLL